MASPAVPDHEALATVLLGATRPIFLTGMRLGHAEPVTDWSVSDWRARASLEAFITEPSAFWAFFYPLAQSLAARAPDAGHHAITRLQRAGVIGPIITQATDRRHQRAGSPDVVEVYGNLLTAGCSRCGERYGLPEVGELIAASPDGVPRCTTPGCAYPLRPEGTLWNEPLPPAAVTRAWELAGEADAFFVLDSALRTAPISLLPSVPLTRGVPLVVVGELPTQYDRYAALVVRTPSPPVLEALCSLVCPTA